MRRFGCRNRVASLKATVPRAVRGDVCLVGHQDDRGPARFGRWRMARIDAGARVRCGGFIGQDQAGALTARGRCTRCCWRRSARWGGDGAVCQSTA
jgi:hypothetical protein